MTVRQEFVKNDRDNSLKLELQKVFAFATTAFVNHAHHSRGFWGQLSGRPLEASIECLSFLWLTKEFRWEGCTWVSFFSVDSSAQLLSLLCLSLAKPLPCEMMSSSAAAWPGKSPSQFWSLGIKYVYSIAFVWWVSFISFQSQGAPTLC